VVVPQAAHYEGAVAMVQTSGTRSAPIPRTLLGCGHNCEAEAGYVGAAWRQELSREIADFLRIARDQEVGLQGIAGAWEKTHDRVRTLLNDVWTASYNQQHDPQSQTRKLLTAGECKVLMLVRQGLKAPLIAERLCVSVHTVRKHVRNSCDKLHVSGGAAAAAEAERLTLICSDASMRINTQY
jgi:DNA-binding CsgD family transcriptional regulator